MGLLILPMAKVIRPCATRRVSYAVRGAVYPGPALILILLPCFARTKPAIRMIHDLLDSKAGDVPPEI